jgi:hypothetical protein
MTTMTMTPVTPQLSPPWYTFWNEIKASVGASPTVQTSDLDTSRLPYTVTLTVSDNAQAAALASVVAPLTQFGNVAVAVVVKNAQGQVVPPTPPANPDALVSMLTEAMENNPLFKQALAQPIFPGGRVVVWVVVAKAVIQFYNDNLADLYRNFNGVAAAVFGDVLLAAPGGISVSCSTAKE